MGNDGACVALGLKAWKTQIDRADKLFGGPAGNSTDDLLLQLSEVPGENFSFGQGLAQRAFVSAGAVADGDVPITPAPVNGEEHG